MSDKSTYRICLEEEGVTYKVTSIHLLKDGSFKVDVPYCEFKEKGIIIKRPTSYPIIETISINTFIQSVLTSNRPQLSIHASGFVQFSGPGIVSGIDNTTRKIKGMGLMSHPLTNPVFSGPTFSIGAWGFKHGFQKSDGTIKNSIIYEREPLQLLQNQDRSPNTFFIEGWVLPFTKFNNESKIDANELGEEGIIASLNPKVPNKLYPMRIIRLRNIPSIIALLPSFKFTKYAVDFVYGFQMNSPGEKTAEDTWNVMHAIYPDFIRKEYELIDL